jgi:glutamate carboxypeptidase
MDSSPLHSADLSLVELLAEIVSIQSGTSNPKGIRKVQLIASRELDALGFKTQLIEVDGFGPHLVAERLRNDRPSVILDGHMDTVFPPDSDPSFRIDGDRCFGQGVIDMKGGNVCMIGALRRLHRSGILDQLSVRVLLVADEEVGSPSSRGLIRELAPQSDFVLVFEEAGQDGEIVIGRSGIQVADLRVFGVAGHAGNVKGIRRNAIEELAYKVCALREAAYGMQDEGILFSVGTVKGGIAHNVIADAASCLINIRFTSAPLFDKLAKLFADIAVSPHIPGTTAKLTWQESSSPAMPVNEKSLALAKLCQRAGEELGFTVGFQTRGGSSNASLWADAGATVIDGLGPIGGDDHSEREWMSIPSLFNRIGLVERLMITLANQAVSMLQSLPVNDGE